MPLYQASGFGVDEGVEDEGVDLARDVALEASDDLLAVVAQAWLEQIVGARREAILGSTGV